MPAQPPFSTPDIEATFASYPASLRDGLLLLRSWVFAEAAALEGIAPLREALKWGQPAYLAAGRNAASLRLGLPKTGGYAIYVHCQTTLVADFEHAFPGQFSIEGNRAVHFAADEAPKPDPIRHLIRAALSYHLRS